MRKRAAASTQHKAALEIRNGATSPNEKGDLHILAFRPFRQFEYRSDGEKYVANRLNDNTAVIPTICSTTASRKGPASPQVRRINHDPFGFQAILTEPHENPVIYPQLTSAKETIVPQAATRHPLTEAHSGRRIAQETKSLMSLL